MMRDRIRKWLGLDQLASKADIESVLRTMHTLMVQSHPVEPYKPYKKQETVAEVPISFERMQVKALEESMEESDGQKV